MTQTPEPQATSSTCVADIFRAELFVETKDRSEFFLVKQGVNKDRNKRS